MILPLIVVAPALGLAAAATAWKGWRGGLAVVAAVVLLACAFLALALLAPQPATPGGDYGRGQSLVYVGAFLALALAGVGAGALTGLAGRRLALRRHAAMLEVEHPIQERGNAT